MKTTMEKARALLESGDCTCVLCKGDIVYASRERGVAPLMHYLEEGIDLTNFSAADKVVGKASALLYCLMGVREVYAQVMSKAAAQVLIRHGIAVLWSEQVPAIQNRAGDGPCPMEAATAGIDDPAQAPQAIRDALAKLHG